MNRLIEPSLCALPAGRPAPFFDPQQTYAPPTPPPRAAAAYKQVRLEQRFKNPSEAKGAIEAVYRFPLDAGTYVLYWCV